MQSDAELLVTESAALGTEHPSHFSPPTLELGQCQPHTPLHQRALQHSWGSRKDAPKDAPKDAEQPTDIIEHVSSGVCTPER